jgi:hypothetical protein
LFIILEVIQRKEKMNRVKSLTNPFGTILKMRTKPTESLYGQEKPSRLKESSLNLPYRNLLLAMALHHVKGLWPRVLIYLFEPCVVPAA